MKRLREERDADDDSSSINRLPDEIILQILNKVIDLKPLCFCSLISRRFSSIVLQVDSAISFNVPPIQNNVVGDGDGGGGGDGDGDVAPSISYRLDSFHSGMRFLFKLTQVKSLSIHLPSSFRDNNNPRCCLFKWKAKFGSRLESVVFLAPNSICDKEGFYVDGSWSGKGERGMDVGLINQKFGILLHCMKEVVVWHKILLQSIKDLPMLERVSITDLGTRGGRVSLSGEKLRQMKRECVDNDNPSLKVPVSLDVSYYFVPKLKLPVSGCVMKGIYIAVMEVKDLQGGSGTTGTEEDGFEQDNEEEADVYSEAMKEFLEKDMDRMMHVVVT